MGRRIFQVDAFTERPFSGNPAGVCVLTGPADESWMQNVAREMNLSETAFLWRELEGFRLRWFTPQTEVELCGHATLASAHILWEEKHLSPAEPARFVTRSGRLHAELRQGWIEMDFPAEPAVPVPAPPGLAKALGAVPRVTAVNRLHYVVELDSEAAVRNLRPDMDRLAPLGLPVCVTARSEAPDADYVLRFFAPGFGVPEDPVTGSAHCSLVPYWTGRLRKSLLVARQVSSRGGVARVRRGDDRVYIAGRAVTVFRAELCC